MAHILPFSALSAVIVQLSLWLLLTLPTLAQATEVDWLAEVTQPPGDIEATEVTSLLDEQGQEITDLATWKDKRASILRDWRNFLGAYSPLEQPLPLDIETLESETLEYCTRTLIRYQADQGRKVRAYLLTPRSTDGPFPAIVAFHGTSPTTFQKLVGVTGDPERQMGLRLAKVGFVVLCPENFLWEKDSYLASTESVLAPHPGSKGMAVMLADGMRAVDVLVAQTNVDKERIGAFGHSLGAKETLYLTAFDDRIRAAVASEGGIGIHSTNWEAPWYLGAEVKSPDFLRDHHDLIALISPRPFLVLGGETGPGCSDGKRSWPPLLVGQQVSQFYGKPTRIGLLNHHEGHRLSWESGERTIGWLQAYVAEKVSVPPAEVD